LDCEPFPLSGEFAEELGVPEWFSATAATRASGGREHRDGHVRERPAET